MEAAVAPDARLLGASRGQEFLRLGIEPRIPPVLEKNPFIEIVVGHYGDGVVNSNVVAHAIPPNMALVKWLN